MPTFPEGTDPISYAEDGVWAGIGLSAGGGILTAAGIAVESGIVLNTGLAFLLPGLGIWFANSRKLRRHNQIVLNSLNQLEGLTNPGSGFIGPEVIEP